MKNELSIKNSAKIESMQCIAVRESSLSELVMGVLLNLVMFEIIALIIVQLVQQASAGPGQCATAIMLFVFAAMSGWRDFFEMCLALKAAKRHQRLHRIDIKMARQTEGKNTVVEYTRMLHTPLGQKKFACELSRAVKEKADSSMDIAEIADLKWHFFNFSGNVKEVRATVWVFA